MEKISPKPDASRGCPFASISYPTIAADSLAPNGCPISSRAASFDPFGEDYQQDPPEYLKWAREQEPIFYSPKLGYWVITRYDDIKAIFRNNKVFSPSIALEKITPTGDEANAVLASYGYAMNRTLVNEDEPAHMPRRRLLMDPFTPEELRHHEPMVRRLTREYVDRFVDDGRADLVDQMLWEVPLTVALHFLGVPEEDMDVLRKYSIAHTLNTWGRPDPEEQVAVAHAVGNFWNFAGQVLEKMRKDPTGEGWMQYGIRKQAQHPEIVTDSYLHSMMMAGIVAAHETTANATANAMKLLLQNRSAWAEICKDPTLIPGAVEECLRHNGSIAAWRRLVTVNTSVGGVDLPAGAKLLIVTSSANHDQNQFVDADLFDIRRDNASEHLTFGYGSHQCMGKNLARMEMQIFLEEFSLRLPHMKLVEQQFTYVPNTSFRGPEHLWVEWVPEENPERANPQLLNTDLPVALLGASKRSSGRAVLVESAVMVADRVLKVTLVSEDGRPLPRWSVGSHIDVECGKPDITRQYSLCGDPGQTSHYEIAVLADPESRGGSRWIHETVCAGARLKIRGPRNHFPMDEGPTKSIFLAGGIGITPLMAMAQKAKELGQEYEIHYSGSRRSSMAFLDILESMHADRLHTHISEGGQRISFQSLFLLPRENTKIYACGPKRMLDEVERSCAHWPEDSLSIERFESATEKLDPSKEKSFEVELRDTGMVIRIASDQTVLAALRQANIDVPSDCEEGLCGSCEVNVLSGDVDHRDSVLTRAEREANGKMMVCCSRALGGKLVLEL